MRIRQGFGARLGCGALVAAMACSMVGCTHARPSRADMMKRMMERARRNDRGPKLGTEAPNFTLKTLDGEREVELASFRGSKPVVLVFGSYT